MIKFLAALAIFHQDDLMKKMNKITLTVRNGCFYKMDDQPVHTTPNHHAPKVVVLPKTFLQIILDAKMVSAAFKYFTPTTSDNLDLPFFIYLLLRGSATSAMLLFRWLRS